MRELSVIDAEACCGLSAAVLDQDEAGRIAPKFKALGDPVRLRLAALIAGQAEICVCDLTPHFAQSGPTISHHLKILREAGLVDCERRGTWVYYWIEPDVLNALGTILRLTPAS